jgi:hypothetical protein
MADFSFDFKKTKHFAVRGTLPDGRSDTGDYYLIKSVSILHATYQVRLLAYFAWKEGTKLRIRLPKKAARGNSLEKLMKLLENVIILERI